jgi:hypothetical protein
VFALKARHRRKLIQDVPAPRDRNGHIALWGPPPTRHVLALIPGGTNQLQALSKRMAATGRDSILGELDWTAGASRGGSDLILPASVVELLERQRGNKPRLQYWRIVHDTGLGFKRSFRRGTQTPV